MKIVGVRIHVAPRITYRILTGFFIIVTTPELGTLYKAFCGSCSHPAKLELYDFPAYLASVFLTWKTVWTRYSVML